MSPNEYHFVTHWRVEATIEEVFAILEQPLDLVRWWPSVYLRVAQAGPAVYELRTRGWLPYTLTWSFRITESRPPAEISLQAWGDFEGAGVWTLVQDGRHAAVIYDWRVKAEKPLLRYLSFLLRPIFSANHRWAMAQGETSLRRELARRRSAQTTPPRHLLAD